MPHAGNFQGQFGWGAETPDGECVPLIDQCVPAHCRGVGLEDL